MPSNTFIDLLPHAGDRSLGHCRDKLHTPEKLTTKDVLKDPEIPFQQRKLLARQIEGLLKATLDEITR